MSCGELIVAMAARNHWTSTAGKTLAGTLYASILKETKTQGIRFHGLFVGLTADTSQMRAVVLAWPEAMVRPSVAKATVRGAGLAMPDLQRFAVIHPPQPNCPVLAR